MPTARRPLSLLRPLALFGTVLVLTVLSCTRDLTGPDSGARGARVARGLSFQTIFPAMAGEGSASLHDVVPFTTVHVVIRHSDGTVALDTLVAFPSGADSVSLDLQVSLLADAPVTGEPMAIVLDYINAQGVTVFHGGPVTVIAAPGLQQAAPVAVPVAYTGPGATAKSVRIRPDTQAVTTGGAFSFSAAALDGNGSPIAGTPIVWSALDATATLTSSAAGSGTAGSARGTARIVAQLLTGPADTAIVLVQPKPSGIAVGSGDAQTAIAGGALPLPVTAHVTASDGGGVAGVVVAFAANNNGSVDSATVTTDANGNASTHWTLGPTEGAQSLTASASGLSGSPVTFHATASAGPVVALHLTGLPDTVSAATPFSVTVTAVDKAGNTNSAFTDTVTLALGANPRTDVLGGTLRVPAVAGVATFGGLTLNKAGTGYTLVASATGPASATSAPFTVRAGGVAACTLQAGGNQTAAAGSTLGPISVLAVDSKSNPVAGTSLTAAISAGTVSPGTATTDATGLATFSWTLGATAGAQTLSVTCGATTLVVNATATAVSGAKTWNGSVNTDWNTAGNWTPSGVPTSTDTVMILTTSSVPVLSSNATVKAVIAGPGATFNVGSNMLTITGNLQVTSPVTGSEGSVQVSGSGTVRANLNVPLVVTGTYSLASNTSASDVAVNGSGSLTLGGHTLTVGGAFTTASAGTLVMTNATDTLSVSGNGTFMGGDETGKLTAGHLLLGGSFVQTTGATAFVAAPAFVTRLTGEAASISFGNPSSSNFGRLEIAGPGGASLNSNMSVLGDLWLDSHATPMFTSQANDTVTIAGALYDTVGGYWHAATTKLTGVNAPMPLTFTGNLIIANANALSRPLAVVQSLTVQGGGAVLDPNGHPVIVGDSLATLSNGVLKMVHAADTVLVVGDANFNGASTAGKLTAGYLQIGGAHFTQGTNAASFAADSAHETNFVESAASGITSHTITFANPGPSHFADLYLADTLTIVGSDISVTGELETGTVISHRVVSVTGDHLLTSNGADVRNLTFDNTRWRLLSGDDIGSMDYVVFQNISNTAAVQFEWNRNGTSHNYTGLYGWSFFTRPTTGLYIKMTSTGGQVDTLTMGVNTPALNGGYIQANGGGVIAGWPNYLVFTGSNHSSWNTFGNWNNSPSLIPDSTTDVVIPDGDTLSLGANAFAKSLTLNGHSLLSQGSYDLEVHGNLQMDTVYSRINCSGGTTYQKVTAAATVQGQFCRYHSLGPITQTGGVSVTGDFAVTNGTFTLNGHGVTAASALIGGSANATGALMMTHPGDSLIVADSMFVGANLGATPSAGVSTLSSGTIAVGGNFAVYGAPGSGYFNSQVGQQVRLGGPGVSTVLFTDTTASEFGTLTMSSSHALLSPARVQGTFYLLGASALTGSTGRLKVGGNFYGAIPSSVTTNAFELAGANSDSGTFSPDTAVYTGSGQVIADSLAPAIGGYNYKSIRVAGSATIQPYGASGTIFTNGKLIVTGNLRIGNGLPFNLYVGDSLITGGSGVLRMVDASSVLHVGGNALFSGGSTSGLLTAGTLDLAGNFAQSGTNSATSFASDSAMTTKFTSSAGQDVSFDSPGTGAGGSHFGALLLANTEPTTGVHLSSNVFADGQLLLVVPTSDSGTFTGSGVVLTAKGANVPGSSSRRLVFNNVLFTLTDGDAMTEFDGATFRNFGTITPLVFARSSGTYTLRNLNWAYPSFPYVPTNPLINVSGGPGVTVNLSSPTPGYTYWVLATFVLNAAGAVVNLVIPP